MDVSTVIVIILLVAIAVLVVLYFLNARGDARFKFDIGGAGPTASGGTDTSPEGGMRSRLIGLGAFAAGTVAVLLGRLVSMQVVSSDDYIQQAESNRTRTITTAAPRGRILDRNGNEIVSNRASLTVVADSSVADNALEVQLLADILGMPAVAVRRNIEDTTEGVQSARTVAMDVTRQVVAFIGEHPSLFEGVSVEQRTVRSYPHGTLACHVVGYTGTVSSDQLKASEESTDEGAIKYQSGDTVGQAGAEYTYESVLQGVRGEQNVYVDANGNVLDYSTSIAPKSGSDVVLTLDIDVQTAAEASLAKVIKKIRSSVSPTCDAGSVVAMDVTNGEILAMASAPTYSPNIFVGGISSDDWTNLQSEESDNPLMNRAISGQYPSGSTIKPLSSFAALENGIATAESHYYCSGWWTGFGEAAGQWCWDHEGHGDMTVQTGITYSCDVVFYEIGKGFFLSDNPEGLQATYRKWGLGEFTGIDLPGEGQGRVPDAEWKYNYYSNYPEEDRLWKGGDFTNLAIGQGDLLVTPMQMACVYAGIANRGTVYKPHVLKSVKSATGTGSVIDYKTSVLRTVDEKDDYHDLVDAGLKGVISTESQYVAAHFASMSVSVAGKSGTAERANENPLGWFVAYAPADDPKYVVAATVENSTWGADTAMYVVRDTLGALFGQPDPMVMGNPSAAGD